tara:strand:- start:104 stop:538 length:435 start_codon:yes stop_codon:yes gene_type:complete
MSKWDKNTFIETAKSTCYPHISNILIDLVNFADVSADNISWGKGKGYGTMTYKCKSDDFGMVPLFHLTTNGQIKFQLNYMRSNINKREIVKDFQLKLESNFLMDFDEEECPADCFYEVDDLFTIKHEVDKFVDTIQGISARLKQ